jgi:hypothetical protein
MRAVLYKASIDRLFKRMRFAQSVLTQQAVNTLKGPVKDAAVEPPISVVAILKAGRQPPALLS